MIKKDLPVRQEIRKAPTGLKYTEFKNTREEVIGRTLTNSDIILIEGEFTSVEAGTELATRFKQLYSGGIKKSDLYLTTLLKTNAKGEIISNKPILALRSNAKLSAGYLVEIGELPKDPKLIEKILKDHGVNVVFTGRRIIKQGIQTMEFTSSKGNFYMSIDGYIFK